MLTLLLGPSGSGKSVRLLNTLKARAEMGQQSIFIVPEQFTSSTEGTLYHTLGDSLSGYVESYSFTSLAEALLRRYGGAAVETLNEAGRAVLVRRAVQGLLDKVVYYSRQRQTATFCEKASQTIQEFKSSGITPQLLEEYANATEADYDKLHELALIYGSYEALLGRTVMDPGDRVELAAEMLQPDFFAGRAVFIDEFDTFNASKKAILAAMLPVADVTVSLCCDGLQDTTGGVGVFSGAKRVANALLRMAQQAGVEAHIETPQQDLRHSAAPVLAELNLLLMDPTYTPEVTADPDADPANAAITYYRADSRQDEAKAVAAAIRAKARAGMPYRRMAVICRDSATYLSAIRYEFRLQDIPLFCDEATTPENTAPAHAVHAALDLLRGGISSTNVLRLLKTGLVDLPEDAQCALENYTYTWPLYAEDWRKEFTRNPSGYTDRWEEQDKTDLALAEQARAFLVSRIEKFISRARGAGVDELSRRIYLFLQSLGAENTLGELAEQLRVQGELPAAEEALREWNVVMGLLNTMVQLTAPENEASETSENKSGAADRISPAEYADLFTLLLRTTDMGHIPQTMDSVIFTTAGRMRLPETDAVFVMGLAEGEFPQTPGDSGLLTHADRDLMIGLGAELPDCFENRVLREQVCFYKALTAARTSLWLSWPGGAAGLPVSAAVEPVLKLLEVPEYRPDEAQLAATPAAALDLLGGLWQENTPQREAVLAALREREQQTGTAQESFAVLQRAAGRETATVTDTEALEKLLGKNLHISPTRFERYATCPFGYFMQYVLRARPRTKAELAPNISGTLTHWVLENALSREGDRFTELAPDEITALVNTLADEYVQANLPGMNVRMVYLVSRLSRNLVRLLGYIQRDMKQSGFRPVAYELRIGKGEPGENAVPPVELEDGLGHTVRVIGTIDRVDAMELQEKTYLRVVDYKTGNKKFDLKEVYCGLDCQMLMYLFTLERNGGALYQNPIAAGVEYLLADPAPETKDRADAEAATEDAEQNYPLDGLLLDEESIYRAMDTAGTGSFVPLRFSAKTGTADSRSAKHLADPDKLGRIRDHLDGMLIEMSRNLYSGSIAAEPLCVGGKSPCDYCDYRSACPHIDGENERTIDIKNDPFELQAAKGEGEENDG